MPVQCKCPNATTCEPQDTLSPLHMGAGVDFSVTWDRHWSRKKEAALADKLIKKRMKLASLGVFIGKPALYCAMITRKVVLNAMFISSAGEAEARCEGCGGSRVEVRIRQDADRSKIKRLLAAGNHVQAAERESSTSRSARRRGLWWRQKSWRSP